MDNLGAHKAVVDLLKQANVLPWFYLGGCTDELQAVDCHCGACIKCLYTKFQEEWCEHDDNLDLWESESISASMHRVLITQWIGKAHLAMRAKSKVCSPLIIAYTFLFLF